VSLEAADIGELDHLAAFGRRAGPIFRRVQLKGSMPPHR